MKHRFFSSLFTAMVGALAFTSCSNEVIDNTLATGKKQMTFTASYDKNISSRTTLGDDLSVLWASDDVISVLDGTNNNDFTLSTGAGNSTAEFNGTASETSSYYAVYPYQSGATISGNVISGVVIPATQTATLNSFDPKANIMTAVSNSANNLAFKNVCSYAKITTTAACKKIIFTAGAEDNIAGTFNMTVGTDGIAIATATAGVNTVTLVPSSGESFAAGTYYIAINAGIISSLKVECIGTENTLFNSISQSIDMFTRGSIIDLGNASVEDGWKEPCCPNEKHPHLIDLNLPSGLKWACMNLGASSPDNYGDYFSWGATEPFYTVRPIQNGPLILRDDKSEGYIWTNTPYQTINTTNAFDEGVKFTKYLGSTTSQYKDPSATDEDALKTVLDPEDDAAVQNWGNGWRMPITEEFKELYDNTYWVWTSDYKSTGINGYIVYKAKEESHKGKRKYANSGDDFTSQYSLSDTHIFFPTAGEICTDKLSEAGSYAYYWSASVRTEYPRLVSIMTFYPNVVIPQGSGFRTPVRCDGRPIRPVKN